MTDVELPRDLRRVDVLALEREGGIARGDPKRRDLGEVRDDVLADAVRKVLLLRIAAHVGERQNANGQASSRLHLGLLTLDMACRMQGEDMYWTLDAFRRVFAKVFELVRHLSNHVVAYRTRESDAANGCNRLQPRGD